MTIPKALGMIVAAWWGATVSVAGAASHSSAEAAKANALFERAWQEAVERTPLLQAQLGIKKDTDKWNDISDARAAEDLSRSLALVAELKRTVDFEALDPQTKLSYRLFVDNVERATRGFQYRFHNYPVSQNGGLHSFVATVLANLHRVDTADDARAYVARLNGIGPLFDQLIVNLRARRDRGIVPPRWVFPRVRETVRNLLTGAPFDETDAPSPIWADFTRKMAQLGGVDDAEKNALLDSGRVALREGVKPAYERLLACWAEIETAATDEDGAWKFPDGAAFYENALADITTTKRTADDIHRIGLEEVARLHGEMLRVIEAVDFSSEDKDPPRRLQAFFRFLREDPRFYLPNTPESRETYLAQANAVIDAMRARLDDLFLTKPKAGLVVRATEPFREKTAAKAFYQRASPDGSRPGVFYATLYDLREMPLYQLESIAYHEAIPGHHMQLAIAQELEGLPQFRRNGLVLAYVEGWGLYCERLPKEIGFYEDPYSDFGRLAMELWRAVRLVVDTGIHAKRWTRRQAIDYFVANTPQSEAEVVREIERYIVNPGQATAYKIGMLKILELRDRARRELGERFDLRAFHDVVLRDGPVPLDVLEENVSAWIGRKQG